MEYKINLRDLLIHVDPIVLDYTEWINVGMALKDEGYSCDVWDEWSARDGRRYHPGECAQKWKGFHGTANPVTGGTIVALAKDQGWRPERPDRDDHALDWDAVIGGGEDDDLVIVRPAWLELTEVKAPGEWHPAKQLIQYLELLFDPSENVGYVTESWRKEGKALPTKGHCDRTAAELIQALVKCGDDIGSVIGDYDPGVGAWIRFNPLDGRGVKNENVTDHRYCLVESDTLEIEQQNAIIRELELPVACLLFSGGKSLHAIVRVDAKDYDEYRKRVDYIYSVCDKNGLQIDKQNRNPSRLSRMPGVMRDGQWQYIIDTNIGKSSYQEWQEWIEGVNDNLPDPELLATVFDALPELAPPLIDGVLRQGHKMLLAGPSKAGKSFALIELATAIAEGKPWIGLPCAQGRVLYVNLELDRTSCLHRFHDVYAALGWSPDHLANIDIWNLRGHAIPMDKLAPKLIRRAAKKNYIAVIIDPIYKVITGDENSADQMAQFCNQFDKVCNELGVAVIYCHHYNKGGGTYRKASDRVSGSGVFARDPDAILNLSELMITPELIAQEENKAVCATCCTALDRGLPGWEMEVSQDALCSEKEMLSACNRLMGLATYQQLLPSIVAARKRVKAKAAWRVEGIMREFPRLDPINVWFDYPVHYLDDIGTLKDIDTENEAPAWKQNFTKNKQKNKGKDQQRAEFSRAMNLCRSNGQVTTVENVAEYLGVSDKTVRRRVMEIGGYQIKQGQIDVSQIHEGVDKSKNLGVSTGTN